MNCGNIGFVGAGKMGGAILSAILKSGRVLPNAVTVNDVSADRLRELAASLGVGTGSIREVVLKSDTIFLCVKPQDLGAVLESLSAVDSVSGKLFVSIAAGRRLDWIESRLLGARVIRVMPNLGVLVGEGMTVFSPGSLASDADCARLAELLECTGRVMRLAESALDCVTALSGSGPAFFAWFIRAMSSAASTLGISAQEAEKLAVQTMFGTAAVLSDGGTTVNDFIRAVTSPNGTTAEGLAVLDGSDAADVISATLAAACRRSRELSMIP